MSPSTPKRIILLCDGTGNSASRSNERNTNVKRLLDVIAPAYRGERSLCNDRTHERNNNTGRCRTCKTTRFVGQQVVYYQSGVGTSTDMGDLSVNYAQGTGAGINDNILDAYCWLANNYQYGDEIFIFGFSRGAFTARVVANLVIQLGLFFKNRMYMLQKAWAQYTKEDTANWEYFKSELWSKHYKFTRPVSIRVLGVWDTVGAVGLPDYMPAWMSSKKFHQSNVLNGIDFVFHALAIDEYRRTFGPTLFYLPDRKDKRKYPNKQTGILEEFEDNETVLKQCWFAGAHSNVGGSYPSEHIADIALGWMIDQMKLYGNLLAFDPFSLYLVVERHLDPAKNISDLYQDDPGTYPGWGVGSVYNSFNGSSNSIDFITYQFRAPGLYSPGKNPGPAGVYSPTALEKITWKDYEGYGWADTAKAVSSYLPSMPSIPVSAKDLKPSAIKTSVGKGLHSLRLMAPSFGSKEIEEEQKEIAWKKKEKAKIEVEWEMYLNALRAKIDKSSTKELISAGVEEQEDDSSETEKYCQRKECCHPARKGRYRRVLLKVPFQKEPVQFPLIENDRQYATCETIHASVFARYKAHFDATVTKAKEEEKRNEEKETYEGKKYVPVSICDWKPPALFPFMYESDESGRPLTKDGKSEPYSRYRRKEIFPGGPVIWTGVCAADPKNKRYFEMLEEPDCLYKNLGDLEDIKRLNQLHSNDLLARSLKRLEVGDTTLKMNRAASGLTNDNPRRLKETKSSSQIHAIKQKSLNNEHANGEHADDEPVRTQSFSARLTPNALSTPPDSAVATPTSEYPPPIQPIDFEKFKKRFMDALYLEDGFDVTKKPEMEVERLARWNKIRASSNTSKAQRFFASLTYSTAVEKEYDIAAKN